MQVQVLAADPPHAAAQDGATGSAQQQSELTKRLEAALSVKNVEAALSERRFNLAATGHAEKCLVWIDGVRPAPPSASHLPTVQVPVCVQ